MCDKVKELHDACDYCGIVAMCCEANSTAKELQAARHPYASFLYSALGRAYQWQGQYGKAIEYHTQHLAIAKEVGDRAGEGRAYGNLGGSYVHLHQHVKAVSCFKAEFDIREVDYTQVHLWPEKFKWHVPGDAIEVFLGALYAWQQRRAGQQAVRKLRC